MEEEEEEEEDERRCCRRSSKGRRKRRTQEARKAHKVKLSSTIQSADVNEALAWRGDGRHTALPSLATSRSKGVGLLFPSAAQPEATLTSNTLWYHRRP